MKEREVVAAAALSVARYRLVRVAGMGVPPLEILFSGDGRLEE